LAEEPLSTEEVGTAYGLVVVDDYAASAFELTFPDSPTMLVEFGAFFTTCCVHTCQLRC
jgi:hypothetical protein